VSGDEQEKCNYTQGGGDRGLWVRTFSPPPIFPSSLSSLFPFAQPQRGENKLDATIRQQVIQQPVQSTASSLGPRRLFDVLLWASFPSLAPKREYAILSVCGMRTDRQR
jgi:hypothetical protein